MLSRYQHPRDTWFLEGRCLLALKREVAGACGGTGVSCRGVHGTEGQVQRDGFERQPLRRPCLEGRAVEWKVLEEGVPHRPGCGVAAPGGLRWTSVILRAGDLNSGIFGGISRVPRGVGESGLTVVTHPTRDWGWSPSRQGHCSELWVQGPGESAEEQAGRGLGLNSQQRPGRSAGGGPSGREGEEV